MIYLNENDILIREMREPDPQIFSDEEIKQLYQAKKDNFNAFEKMKNNMGLAGGLVTGLGIGLGGIGASILGNIADIITLPVLLKYIPLIALGALIMSFFLPGKYSKNSVHQNIWSLFFFLLIYLWLIYNPIIKN